MTKYRFDGHEPKGSIQFLLAEQALVRKGGIPENPLTAASNKKKLARILEYFAERGIDQDTLTSLEDRLEWHSKFEHGKHGVFRGITKDELRPLAEYIWKFFLVRIGKGAWVSMPDENGLYDVEVLRFKQDAPWTQCGSSLVFDKNNVEHLKWLLYQQRSGLPAIMV